MPYFGYDPKQDSPPIQKAPALGIGASREYQFEGVPTSIEPGAKYIPFNQMTIQNVSTNDVTITFPNGRLIKCKGGQTVIAEKRDVQAMRAFKVTNDGAGAINANELVITLQRIGIDTQDVAQGIGKVFGSLFGGQYV